MWHDQIRDIDFMRIYEFSKDRGVPTKEVMAALKKKGFEVGSHMSVLDQKAIDFLNKAFSAEEKKVDQKGLSKPRGAASVKSKPFVGKKSYTAPRSDSRERAQVGESPVRIGSQRRQVVESGGEAQVDPGPLGGYVQGPLHLELALQHPAAELDRIGPCRLEQLDERERRLTQHAQRLDERARLLGIAERADDNVFCDGALDPLIRDLYPHPRIVRNAS